MPTPNRVVVVQYEQFFNLNEAADIPEAVREALDALRGLGGARVVGSYEAIEDARFLAKAVDSITISGPVTLSVD